MNSWRRKDFTVVDLGYIEPGHGMKRRLNSEDDVSEMYKKHVKRCTIFMVGSL